MSKGSFNFVASIGGITSGNSDVADPNLSFMNEIKPKATPSSETNKKIGSFTTVTTLSDKQLEAIKEKPDWRNVGDIVESRLHYLKQVERKGLTGDYVDPYFLNSAGELNMHRILVEKCKLEKEKAAEDSANLRWKKHYARLDLAESGWNRVKGIGVGLYNKAKSVSVDDLIKNGKDKSKTMADICKTSPYFECTACQWSKKEFGLDGVLEGLFGSKKQLDALKSGSVDDDMLANCPGRKRELAMDKLMSGDILDGTTALIATVTGNITQMVSAATSGNATLFRDITAAACEGDMKGLAQNQMNGLAKSLISNNSTVRDLSEAMSNLGMNSDNILAASLPENLGGEGMNALKGSFDVSRITGFNGLSTGNMASLINNVPGQMVTMNTRTQDMLKMSSSVAAITGKATTLPVDIARGAEKTSAMLAKTMGKDEASKYVKVANNVSNAASRPELAVTKAQA